ITSCQPHGGLYVSYARSFRWRRFLESLRARPELRWTSRTAAARHRSTSAQSMCRGTDLQSLVAVLCGRPCEFQASEKCRAMNRRDEFYANFIEAVVDADASCLSECESGRRRSQFRAVLASPQHQLTADAKSASADGRDLSRSDRNIAHQSRGSAALADTPGQVNRP